MFTVNDQEYELRYSLKTMKQIEAAAGQSAPAMLASGMIGLTSLTTFIGYGLVNPTTGGRISPAQGLEVAEKLIETQGYVEANTQMQEAIMRDCPFLFLTD